MLWWFVAFAQAGALLILLQRLGRGRTMRPPLTVNATEAQTQVSVVIPTLNEELRLGPCLEGLHLQGTLLKEVIVVDSRSQDGTVALVEKMALRDPRFRVVTDDPLPKDWVGRPWALQYGLEQARGEWLLGIDADTVPQAGLINALVQAASDLNYDAVSLAPRFIFKTAGENWLHPALLMTLIYRFGPTGASQDPPPERMLGNGQCFLVKREKLLAAGGYHCAKASFCDDVTLVRHLARNGLRVGFLDGSRLIKVRMYSSFLETWREWGRSLDLKDATTPTQQWADVIFLGLTLGLPLPLLLLSLTGIVPTLLIGINGVLLTLRLLLQLAVVPSCEGINLWFWLSPLADPLAALRILLSTLQRPRSWRGRSYATK